MERRVLKQEKGKAKRALEPKQLEKVQKVLANAVAKRPCDSDGKENEPPKKRRRSADRDIIVGAALGLV